MHDTTFGSTENIKDQAVEAQTLQNAEEVFDPSVPKKKTRKKSIPLTLPTIPFSSGPIVSPKQRQLSSPQSPPSNPLPLSNLTTNKKQEGQEAQSSNSIFHSPLVKSSHIRNTSVSLTHFLSPLQQHPQIKAHNPSIQLGKSNVSSISDLATQAEQVIDVLKESRRFSSLKKEIEVENSKENSDPLVLNQDLYQQGRNKLDKYRKQKGKEQDIIPTRVVNHSPSVQKILIGAHSLYQNISPIQDLIINAGFKDEQKQSSPLNTGHPPKTTQQTKKEIIASCSMAISTDSNEKKSIHEKVESNAPSLTESVSTTKLKAYEEAIKIATTSQQTAKRLAKEKEDLLRILQQQADQFYEMQNFIQKQTDEISRLKEELALSKGKDKDKDKSS